MIKKYKNGNIVLRAEVQDYNHDGEVSEDFYFNEMFNHDLYIENVNDYSYLMDYNTNRVYFLGRYMVQNPLKWLLDELKGKTYKFYPLSEVDGSAVLEELRDSY